MSALDLLLGELPEIAPGILPAEIEHLSPSSIDQLWKCPEQWRREKFGREPRAITSNKLFGSAFHRAAEHNFSAKIETHEDLPVAEMRDVSGESFNSVLEESKGEAEIVWNEKPDAVQKGVIRAMVGEGSHPGYHQVLAPTIQPVSVERSFRVELPIGVPLTGRIDVETEKAIVVDLKTSGKSKTQHDIDTSTQATSYLWAREQEGVPAEGFAWHLSVTTKTPKQQELVTERSPGELLGFERLIETTAQTIRHYFDTYGPDGPWPGASPLGWWCSPRQCSFWSSCCWRGGAK